MKAVVLSDNIGSGSLSGEWGLSIYIEYNESRILLDFGTTGLFRKNAQQLGVDLSAVDFCVLSHAHFDHSDGMPDFFEVNSAAPVYIRAECQENCWGMIDGKRQYAGLRKGMLDRYADRIMRIDKQFSPVPGVTLLGHSYSASHPSLTVQVGDEFLPDDFRHEQSLIFETTSGLVICNSCSHTGADNIIREVSEAFPGKKIAAYIGGLHLYEHTDEAVRSFASRVKACGIGQIYTGHCTGDRAYRILKEELGDAVDQFHVGMAISL